MPNEMKYGNVEWPADSPIGGERMATAGEYTGQHRGTPVADALAGADNAPYGRERGTVRLGTITPDAADGNFPPRLVTVAYAASGTVTEISVRGASYDPDAGKFLDVPLKTESFTFKDGETAKTATNDGGAWKFA